MLNPIDKLLNQITMYRLALYYLTVLYVVAVGFSFFDLVPYSALSLLISAVVILAICFLANILFAKVFKVPTNVESVYITAFILVLIISPARTSSEYISFLTFAAIASLIAIASKYILAIKQKHVFNPAAIAVVLTSLLFGFSASWWVGTAVMLPFVLIGGFLMIRKLQRWDMVLSFFVAALVMILGMRYFNGTLTSTDAVWNILRRVALDSPIFFFAFIMLTEPLTAPPTRGLRMLYGALNGLLFAPGLRFGFFHSTPENALVIGNIFSYLASPKQKLMLRLKEKITVAAGVDHFIFSADESLRFTAGQYLEWTVSPDGADTRGNRRYFTLASSPTDALSDKEIAIGVKFYSGGSSFKRALASLKPGDMITAGSLAGDFTLPKDKKEKLVFIAGGIGVTPFVSMVRELISQKEQRDIVLLYSNKTKEDIAYAGLFEKGIEIGLQTVYVNTDTDGLLTKERILEEIPDYLERTFYLSGPHGMVTAFETTLKKMHVPRRQIKTDFFPGFV